MKKEDLKTIVIEEGKKVLNSETFFNKETNTYEDEIYMDYRDWEYLRSHLISTLKETDNCKTINELRDTISDDFFEMFNNTANEMRDYIQDIIFDKVTERLEEIFGESLDINDYQDEVYFMISDFLEKENYQIIYPDDFYYNEIELGFNVVLDTGDGNYDFTLNSIDDLDESPVLDEKSSLLWLIKQQGYQLSDIKDYAPENKFLSSVENELLNVYRGMNTVTFFVKMNLNQYLSIQEKLNGKDDFNLVIPKNTVCGLIDYWNGSGSLLEIDLEKDVIIPKQYIWKLSTDNNIDRYGASEIYGFYENDSSLWKTEVKIS